MLSGFGHFGNRRIIKMRKIVQNCTAVKGTGLAVKGVVKGL